MAGKLRSLFTNRMVENCVYVAQREDGSIDYVEMSEALSDYIDGITISPELCVYWASQFTHSKPAKTLSQVNTNLKETRTLRTPKPEDYDAIWGTKEYSLNESVLIIPDMHSPYQHPDTIPFLVAVRNKYKPDRVVNLGDETDKHGLSFHDSDPNLDSAGMELEKAKLFLSALAKEFPVMEIMHSNHGSLLFSKAKAHGIPVQYLKTYREVLFPNGGGDGWSWHDGLKIKLPNGDTVLFRHEPQGDVTQAAGHEGLNLCCGYLHGKFCINYAASSERLYWGMQVGCLIDNKSLAFAYGKLFKSKPIIGCAVIIDSIPSLVPMRLDEEGRWIGEL
jgi:hypothetical protein